MIHAIGEKIPQIHESAFVAWNAEVAGSVKLARNASVWFGATLRADVAPIVIGEGTNVQDGSVIHVDEGVPCTVGENVTIGHRAVLHGCTVGDGCLIGMGAIILGNAEIGPGSVVGAGALVTQGKCFPPRSLIVGSPARCVRQLSPEDADRILGGAAHYVGRAAEAKGYGEINR
mgnify:CR=1 FL=1